MLCQSAARLDHTLSQTALDRVAEAESTAALLSLPSHRHPMSTALTPAASSTGASKRAGPGSSTSASASAGAVAVSYAHADIGLAPNNWLQQRLQAAEIEQQKAQRKTDAKLEKLIRSKVVDLGVPAMRTNAAAAAASVQSPSLSTAAAAAPSLAFDFPDLFSGGAALLASLTGQGGASSHRSSICSSMNQKSSKVVISHTRVKIKDAKKESAAAAAATTAAASAQVAVAPVPAASAPAASAAPAFGSSFTAARFTARSTNRVAPSAAAAAGCRTAILHSNPAAANAASKPAILLAPVAGSGRKRSSDAVTAATATAPAAAPAVRGSGGSAKKRKIGDAPAAGATPLRHSARLTFGSPALGSLLSTPQTEKEIRIEETPCATVGSGATSGHGRTPRTGTTKGAGGSTQPVGFRVRKKLFGSPAHTARPPASSAGSGTSFSLRLSPAPAANAATVVAATSSTPSPGSSHRSLFVGATPSPASSRRTPGLSGASSRAAPHDPSPAIAATSAKVHPVSPSVSPTVATRLGKHHSIKRPLLFDDPAPADAVEPAEQEQPQLPVGKKARRGEKATIAALPVSGSFSIHTPVVLSASASSAAPFRALSIVPEAATQQEQGEEAEDADVDQPRKPASQRKPRRKHKSTAASATNVAAPRETRSQRAR